MEEISETVQGLFLWIKTPYLEGFQGRDYENFFKLYLIQCCDRRTCMNTGPDGNTLTLPDGWIENRTAIGPPAKFTFYAGTHSPNFTSTTFRLCNYYLYVFGKILYLLQLNIFP